MLVKTDDPTQADMVKETFAASFTDYDVQITDAEISVIKDKITSGDIDWMLNDGRGVVAELYAQMKGYALRPKVIVEYTRTPFIYKAGNVRVTLDCNIRSGVFSTDLFNPASLVHTGDMDVLEVKYDRFLPDIVKMAIYPIGHDRESMSKYEVCRKFG